MTHLNNIIQYQVSIEIGRPSGIYTGTKQTLKYSGEVTFNIY